MATQIHPKYLADHKEGMEKKGLIKVEIRGWKKELKKRGRAQFLSITPQGIKWLIFYLNSSLQKILGPLSQTLNDLTHETDVKDSFRKDLSGISGEDFESAKSDVKVIFKPFTDLLRSIVVLQLWLQPNYHPLAGVAPWMQLLESKPPTPELSIEEAKHIVEGNYFLFGPNMAGFIPIPPLPTDEKITVSYLQNAWKFVESLKPKDGPLHPLPFKDPSKDKFKRKEEK